MSDSRPSQLGRYEIQAVLGKGSMGVVYLARDPLIGRPVALKTFRPNLSGDDDELSRFRSRFLREAQSAGILSHPNIVTIHDVVEEGPEGAAFIAMEYVQGTNLKEVLRYGKPLDLDQVVSVVRQIADALDYAHDKKVVHRDVKPANVLLTPERQVKLTDFGIARFDSSNLTHDGQLLGTPNYMSPEQVQGREVDHHTDLFSLGVILYEMITRHKPFAAENLTAVTHRIVYDDHTPVEQYVGGMPDGLTPILDRALAKDPRQRYDSAGEMAEELRRVVAQYEEQVALSETQSIEGLPLTPPPGTDVGEATRPGGDDTDDATVPGVAASPPIPPPPAGAAGSAAGTGAGEGGGFGVLAALRRWLRPTPAREGTDWRRVLAAGAVAAVLVLVLGWIAAAVLDTDASGLADYDPEYRLHVEYLDWVREGMRLNRDGRPAAAAAAFRRAESLRPDDARVQRLRRVAERRAEAQQMDELRQRQVEVRLEAAEEAFEARRYQEALSTAEAVLADNPDHEPALGVARRARAALARQERQREAARREAEEEARRAAAEPAEGTAAAEGEPALEGEGSLSVRLETEGEGRLVVRADERLLADVGYEFIERVGLFRRKKPYRGVTRLDAIEVEAGRRLIRYEVKPADGPPQVGEIEAEIRPDEARTLVLVYLPDEGLAARVE